MNSPLTFLCKKTRKINLGKGFRNDLLNLYKLFLALIWSLEESRSVFRNGTQPLFAITHAEIITELVSIEASQFDLTKATDFKRHSGAIYPETPLSIIYFGLIIANIKSPAASGSRRSQVAAIS